MLTQTNATKPQRRTTKRAPRIPSQADVQLMADVLRVWHGGRVQLTPQQWARAERLFARHGGL